VWAYHAYAYVCLTIWAPEARPNKLGHSRPQNMPLPYMYYRFTYGCCRPNVGADFTPDARKNHLWQQQQKLCGFLVNKIKDIAKKGLSIWKTQCNCRPYVVAVAILGAQHRRTQFTLQCSLPPNEAISRYSFKTVDAIRMQCIGQWINKLLRIIFGHLVSCTTP